MNIFLASDNPHKLVEFSTMFQDSGLEVNLWSAHAVGGMPPVDENGDTFQENALLKAKALLEPISGTGWILADDSGLEVDSLNGSPGIFSARFAGPAANDKSNTQKLLSEMEDVPDAQRGAAFTCCLALLDPVGQPHFFHGHCHGKIVHEPRGYQGFGYDPVFVPNGQKHTFAELGNKVKHQLSHRAAAFRKLVKTLPSLPDQAQSG